MKRISFLSMLFAVIGMVFSSCGGNVPSDNVVSNNDGKYKSVYQLSQQLMEEDGLYCLTLNEKFINMSLLQKKYLPADEFERLFTENLYLSVTNYYLLDNCPYDTIISSQKSDRLSEEQLAAAAARTNSTDENADNAQMNEDMVTMTRGDFWNAIFAINKEYANVESFADIEKSIIEAHDAVGLSWDDTISVVPGMIENHRAAVKEIFTNMKDGINKRYLK